MHTHRIVDVCVLFHLPLRMTFSSTMLFSCVKSDSGVSSTADVYESSVSVVSISAVSVSVVSLPLSLSIRGLSSSCDKQNLSMTADQVPLLTLINLFN